LYFGAIIEGEGTDERDHGDSLIVTGAVSPMANQALSARGMNITTKALPGLLQ